MKLWNDSYLFAQSGHKPVWTIPWTHWPWQSTFLVVSSALQIQVKLGKAQVAVKQQRVPFVVWWLYWIFSLTRDNSANLEAYQEVQSHPSANAKQHPVEITEAHLSNVTQCVIDIMSGSGPGRSRSELSWSNYFWPKGTALVQQCCFQALLAALYCTTQVKLVIPWSFVLYTSLQSSQGGILLCASYCTILQYRDSASTHPGSFYKLPCSSSRPQERLVCLRAVCSPARSAGLIKTYCCLLTENDLGYEK